MFDNSSFILLAAILPAMCLVGCFQRAPSVGIPSYNASKISAATFEALDANKDNVLDGSEMEKAPGLKASLDDFDSNKDGRISAAELEDQINQFARSHVGLRVENYRFTLNGAPLVDAKVTFVPEPFFADYILSGEGKTDERGSTLVKVAGKPVPGLSYGMYQVSVSKMDGSGNETIPAKYNAQTTLGYSMVPKASGDGSRTFNLKTR